MKKHAGAALAAALMMLAAVLPAVRAENPEIPSAGPAEAAEDLMSALTKTPEILTEAPVTSLSDPEKEQEILTADLTEEPEAPAFEPTEETEPLVYEPTEEPETPASDPEDAERPTNPRRPGEAQDLTAALEFKTSNSTRYIAWMTDGLYTTYWETQRDRHPWIYIKSHTPMYGLYVCYRQMPEEYELQVPVMVTDEEGKEHIQEWVPLMPGETRFHHCFYELDGLTRVRIYATTNSECRIGINELFAFGPGDIPDWVQRWEPTEEKADILFFAAHPDDELIFLGGAIPTYAVEMGKRVVVAYLSYSNYTRRSEALNGLWHMGVRKYPVFGGFKDHWTSKLSSAYSSTGKRKVLSWVTELYRKYRPEVVVTHDLKGEYGHGQHRMMADAAIQGYTLAADPGKYPESEELYGVWQVKKLYVHLYGDESEWTRFNWFTPLQSMGGKMGLELAEEAYALHVTQKKAAVRIHGQWETLSVAGTGSLYPNTAFGLYASEVGPDETHLDFLEHITE